MVAEDLAPPLLLSTELDRQKKVGENAADTQPLGPYPQKQEETVVAEAAVPPPPTPQVKMDRNHNRRRRNRKEALDGLLDGNLLPRRNKTGTTLDPQCMLGRISPELADAVTTYCALAFGNDSSEVALCLAAAAEISPDGLRVKELLETFEAYREIAGFAHDVGKSKPIDTIFDLACGHGILGILLAYRFPKRKVVCVDTSRRPVFDALLQGFNLHGVRLEGEPGPLFNLSFVEGDALKVELPPRSMVAAVHACNELNPRIIERARDVDAVWAVLPCCVRAGTYLPCRIGGTLKDDDESKHMINCGVVAGQYGADRLQAIDRRITNRNVLICGGANFADYAEASRRCSEGRTLQAGVVDVTTVSHE